MDGLGNDQIKTDQLEIPKLIQTFIPHSRYFPSSRNNHIKIADYKESEYTDPAEWLSHSLFIMESLGMQVNEIIAKLVTAIHDSSLRSSVIADLKNGPVTIDNFQHIFLMYTRKDKMLYMKQLQLLKFNDKKDTAVSFFRKLQRIHCKSLMMDLARMNDDVIMMLSANTLRQKLPEYVTRESGFLCHPIEDISLAHYADKLMVSKTLNDGSFKEKKDAESKTELNTILAHMNKMFVGQYNGRSNKKKDANDSKKFQGKCLFCDIKGHKVANCFKLRDDRKKGKNLDWKPRFKNKAKKDFSANLMQIQSGCRDDTAETINVSL